MKTVDPADNTVCTQMATRLRTIDDPNRDVKNKAKLTVRTVARVYEPDARGLTEVLFRNSDGDPWTAFLRDRELAYVTEGW